MKYKELKLAILFFSLMPMTGTAQLLGEPFLGGIARGGADKAEQLLKQAPERFSEIIGESNKIYETEKACLSDLQMYINMAVIISQLMPFSNVWTQELDETAVATFRLMLDGEKAHARISCQGNAMISTLLDWDDPTPDANPYRPGALAASLGVLLSMNQRGEFEREAESAADTTDNTDTGSPDETSRSSESSKIDQVNEALQRALGATSKTGSRAEPLTLSEKRHVRMNLHKCWNVGSLSSEALRTVVIVGFRMEQNGRPEIGSIRLINSAGGGEAAAKQAFEAARRAIIRCGANGFDLPVEKYDEWRYIEMTFIPDTMTIR